MKVMYGLTFWCLVATVIAQRPQISDSALNTILHNDEFVQTQVNCVLGRGSCDVIGTGLKRYVPKVLRHGCPECTPKENGQIQYALSYFQQNYPYEWNQIAGRYSL